VNRASFARQHLPGTCSPAPESSQQFSRLKRLDVLHLDIGVCPALSPDALLHFPGKTNSLRRVPEVPADRAIMATNANGRHGHHHQFDCTIFVFIIPFVSIGFSEGHELARLR
jgi:hypothetical protein